MVVLDLPAEVEILWQRRSDAPDRLGQREDGTIDLARCKYRLTACLALVIAAR